MGVIMFGCGGGYIGVWLALVEGPSRRTQLYLMSSKSSHCGGVQRVCAGPGGGGPGKHVSDLSADCVGRGRELGSGAHATCCV